MDSDNDINKWDNGEGAEVPLNSEQKQDIDEELDRLRRETYRSVRAVDRMRVSASYRLGRLFTESVFSPLRLILLPFRTVSLVWKVGMERLGRREPPALTSKFEYTL